MKRNRVATLICRALVCSAFVSGFAITAMAQSGTWTTKASMPSPRAYFASCVADGKLYAFGGYDGVHLDTVVVYEPTTDSWSSGAPLPAGRTSAEAVEAGGKIYVLGGFLNNGTTLTTRVDVYDPATNTWAVPVAPMLTTRTDFGAAAIDGIIYAVGGSGGAGDVSTVEAYDPVSNTWETKASMPTARSFVAVGVINGLLYAVGSGNGSTAFEVYDPATDTWTVKPPLPTTRFIPSGAVLGGKFYVIGGATSDTLNIVELYDPDTNSWSTGVAMPTDRYAFGVGVVGGVLYVFGGATFTGGFAVLSTVEAFSIEEVASPKELTLDLINLVRGLALQRGISNSFESKLQKVVTALESPSETQDACDHLTAFINHARAQSGKHLTVPQADQLIAAATEIKTALACE